MSRLSLVEMSRGFSLVAMLRLLIAASSFVVEHGLKVHGLWSLWCMGLVDLQHVESSQAGIRPMAPALVRRIPTTGPPGKSHPLTFNLSVFLYLK